MRLYSTSIPRIIVRLPHCVRCCGLFAVSSTIVYPVKQDVEHEPVTEQTNRD
jgi:hypothetical protein